MMAQVFKMQASIKNYDWGKLGIQSIVARLQKEGCNNFTVDEKMPYAEMWIGTHDSGPALIPCLNNIKLKEWLLENPENLGDNIRKIGSHVTGLPFLFKVLSVNKALSIQAHPNKKTAENLHQMSPDKYPDDNHKPEMAIALTDFEALCGFRPLCEIQNFFVKIPHLKTIVDSKIIEKFLSSDSKEELKSLFTAVMTCPPDVFQPELLKILDYFKLQEFNDDLCKSIHDLFLRTYDQYPGDIGLFCLFFLNYLKLKPGEAIFLAANEPHAYLSGNCIECMACSDNVVRAGLTPKFRDVTTLCDILTYNCKNSEENKFLPISDPEDPCVKVFDPPVPEFAVDCIELKPTEVSYALKKLHSASVLLVVEGKGFYKCKNDEGDLTPGSILFISSDCQVFLNPVQELLMFRAYCNA